MISSVSFFWIRVENASKARLAQTTRLMSESEIIGTDLLAAYSLNHHFLSYSRAFFGSRPENMYLGQYDACFCLTFSYTMCAKMYEIPRCLSDMKLRAGCRNSRTSSESLQHPLPLNHRMMGVL